MRAYQFDAFGLENLKLVDVAEPVPGPGEVLLQVRAISLNYRDLMVIRGQYNPHVRSRPHQSATGPASSPPSDRE